MRGWMQSRRGLTIGSCLLLLALAGIGTGLGPSVPVATGAPDGTGVLSAIGDQIAARAEADYQDQDETLDHRQQDQDDKAAAVPTELEAQRQLNRLLSDRDQGLDQAIQYLDQHLRHFPTSSEIHLIAISLNANKGVGLLAQEQVEAAKPFLFKAETLAAKVLADDDHLREADPFLGQVYFFVAQAYAWENRTPEMYRALDQAFELEFDRFDVIEETKVFRQASDSQTLESYLEKQRELVGQRMARRLEREFKSFESFEFDFDLPSIEGQPLRKSDFAGKVLVIDVWGTWCPPCRKEIPRFVDLQQEQGPQGVQVIGLNSENEETQEEKTESVKSAIKEFKINYPCALIDDDFLEKIPDFEGFPTTLLIDGSGRVRLMLVGAQPEQRLEMAVEFLLKEATDRRE